MKEKQTLTALVVETIFILVLILASAINQAQVSSQQLGVLELSI